MAIKSKRSTSSSRAKSLDAIALLKADHRQVEQWFSQFEKTSSANKKQQLASNICAALTVHTSIEEEIFYPAFLRATGDQDMHHEAIVEHARSEEHTSELQSHVNLV